MATHPLYVNMSLQIFEIFPFYHVTDNYLQEFKEKQFIINQNLPSINQNLKLYQKIFFTSVMLVMILYYSFGKLQETSYIVIYAVLLFLIFLLSSFSYINLVISDQSAQISQKQDDISHIYIYICFHQNGFVATSCVISPSERGGERERERESESYYITV